MRLNHIFHPAYSLPQEHRSAKINSLINAFNTYDMFKYVRAYWSRACSLPTLGKERFRCGAGRVKSFFRNWLSKACYLVWISRRWLRVAPDPPSPVRLTTSTTIEITRSAAEVITTLPKIRNRLHCQAHIQFFVGTASRNERIWQAIFINLCSAY